MAYSCVRVVFEIGHEASIRTKCTPEGFTHDWEVFVRGADNTEIKHFVDKVVFYLHETFPKPKRVVKEPPYLVKESGYAGFNLPIEIYFKTLEEPKKVRFNYDLNLQPSGPSISKVLREKYVFRNPDEDLRPRLIRGGGVGVGSDASSHSTSVEKPTSVPTISSSTDEVLPKSSTPQLVGKPKLGGDPAKKHKIKEHRSEEPRVSNSFKDIFGTPIKTAKVSPDPKKPSPSPKVSPLPKPAKPPDKSSSDKSLKPPKHNVQKDSRESSSSTISISKEEKKDKNKERDKSKEKTKHSTTPPKHPPSPPKVPISKLPKEEPKKTQPEESKSKSDSKSPGEPSKSEKKKKDKRNKDEKIKKEKHKEHDSKSNDKLDKGDKSSKESKDKDKDREKDKEVSRKSEKDTSKETEKPKEREKVSSDGDKGDKERSRHKHKKKERNKRDESGKEKDRDREKGGKKSSSDSKKANDTKDKDRNGVSSESIKKRPRSPSHSPARPTPSPKRSPVPEKPPPPPPPPVAKEKPKRPLIKLFDELAQDSSDSNLSPLSGDEDLIEHPSQMSRSPVPAENSSKPETSAKPDVQNETQMTTSSSQANNKLDSSKGKTESANQEKYSLSKMSSNSNSNSTNTSSNSKQKDRSLSKRNKERKESGTSGGGKEESGSKSEKDSSKKRKRKSSGKVKNDVSSGGFEAPASKLPKLDTEHNKSSDHGGQTSADSSSHVEINSVTEDTKDVQAEDEFVAPVSTASAPTTADSSVQFSPDYVSQLKELQRKIMTLEDNAELQRVVQVIAETGQYEITKKTFDFDLCALDRSTVKRLQDFFTTS